MKKTIILGIIFQLAVAGFSQPSINDPFFEKVKFRGAFGTNDWTKGWANFDPQNTVYPETNVTIPTNANGEITSDLTLSSEVSYVFGKQNFTVTGLQDAFIDKTVNYVGAFGSNDWTKGWANWDPQNTPYANVTDLSTLKAGFVSGSDTVINAAGELVKDLTLSRSQVYLITGWIYVTNGRTLTIPSGTIIRGDKITKAAIIVEPGGKMIANGTSSDPIVFTSNQATGSRSYGDWGGIVICGNAVTNQVNPQIEGGPRTHYGGTNDDDNSGSLKYVRFEFPGIAFQPDKEINGLTFGGVGRGTTIEHIQVSYSGDDSYEWFGGTVKCKYLIALRGWDDDFDTDFGFRGVVQFAVALRDPAIADPGSGSNSFESDNDAAGDYAKPYTNAVFTNITLIGPYATPGAIVNTNFKRAMHIRRNSRLQVYNSVFAGWGTGLLMEGKQVAATGTDSIQFKNNIMAGMKADFAVTAGQWTNEVAGEASWFLANNDTLASVDDLQLMDAFSLSTPNFLPEKSVYLIKGFVYVTSGTTLTIAKGTIIRGDKASKASLIIEPGAKLIAEGTVDQPIIMTSNQAPGFRSYGDWGGLILCGNAPVNQVNPQIEGGPRTHYGGTAFNDNSGILKYVRVEFPGIAFQPDKEINGITFGGVGSGTTVDYTQVSYSGDDSYEWFGGTVNCKHMIALRGWDDEYDTDFGYSGKIQFAVALRDPSVADPGSGSNGFESDNDAAGDYNKPYTKATFSNFSLFGPLATPATTYNNNFKRVMHLRRNTRLNVYNSIFAGYPTGLLYEGKQVTIVNTDSVTLTNNTMAGMTDNFAVTAGQWINEVAGEAAWYLAKNDTLTLVTDLKLNDPFNLTAPNFLPKTDSKLLHSSYWTLSKVEISGTAVINTDGGSIQLKTNNMPKYDLDTTVTWSVMSGGVPVNFDQTGKITANSSNSGNGKVKIVATSNDGTLLSDTIEITISNQSGVEVAVTSIAINAASDIINSMKGTLQLSVTVLPVNASVNSVIWSISDGDSLASIDQNGLVTAKGAGDGAVTAQSLAADNSGVKGTKTITLSNQVGIKKNTTRKAYFYPNPVNDMLFVKNASEISNISIFNMLGQSVYNLKALNENSISIDMSGFEQGVYIVTVEGNNINYNVKVVKR